MAYDGFVQWNAVCKRVAEPLASLSIDSCRLPKVSQEADPLTTLFIKARCMAFVDVPNLFALPQPNMDELVPVEEVDKYTKQEYTTRLMEAGQCDVTLVFDHRLRQKNHSLSLCSLPTCRWEISH